MRNRCEKRVALFRGKAMHMVNIKNKMNGSAAAFAATEEEIYRFAEEALSALKMNCNSAICDGLVRVDIFMNAKGKMKVNEFESLEAAYYSGDHKKELLLNTKLEAYWDGLIKNSLIEIYDIRNDF
jgi:hypothetical protein